MEGAGRLGNGAQLLHLLLVTGTVVSTIKLACYCQLLSVDL